MHAVCRTGGAGGHRSVQAATGRSLVAPRAGPAQACRTGCACFLVLWCWSVSVATAHSTHPPQQTAQNMFLIPWLLHAGAARVPGHPDQGSVKQPCCSDRPAATEGAAGSCTRPHQGDRSAAQGVYVCVLCAGMGQLCARAHSQDVTAGCVHHSEWRSRRQAYRTLACKHQCL